MKLMSEQAPPASAGASSPGQPTSSPPPASSPPSAAPSPPAAAPPSRWNRPFLIGIAAGLAVVVIAVGTGILGDVFGGPAGFRGGGPGMFFPAFFPILLPFAGLLALLLPLAIVVGAVWLLVAVLSRSNRGGNDGALEILRQRFARGEISQEEYTRMVEVLKRE
jgi:putative membrane protein